MVVPQVKPCGDREDEQREGLEQLPGALAGHGGIICAPAATVT